MATLGQIAADWMPRLYKQKQLDVKNNNGKLNDPGLIALNCSASQLLKFLKFNVYCIQCTNVEKVIANYSKVIFVCEGKDQSVHCEILKIFTKYGNVFVFPISESVFSWVERLKPAGFQIVQELLFSAFDGAKPIQEVIHNAR